MLSFGGSQECSLTAVYMDTIAKKRECGYAGQRKRILSLNALEWQHFPFSVKLRPGRISSLDLYGNFG